LDALVKRGVIGLDRNVMDRIRTLILLYLREEISETQQQELDAWLDEDSSHRDLLTEIEQADTLAESFAKLDRLDRVGAWERVRAYAEEQRKQPEAEFQRIPVIRRIARWWPAAAAILILLAVGGWWWSQPRQTNTPTVQTVRATDVSAPSRSRATLTLASGRQVDLDSAGNGALATQGGAQIVKGAGGQLAYQLKVEHPGDLLYNTLTNPRGSQVVTLTLSDGTKVWLNAESSIRYPAVFIGSDRAVAMTGEAYFEVAKNPAQPFKVVAAGETIDVLGTAFNINAYSDEAKVRTTLVEGKVNVSADGVSELLSPGQQAAANPDGSDLTLVSHTDLDQALAWRSGRFAFTDADLPTVMRQLARWYAVDVSYEGQIPKREFEGKIPRTLTLDQVLRVLTKARVHYLIDGNHLTIRP
jgi:ferric-dicitrate binding protein FerR (iron transport regulator)